jgi:hypothetical protein
VVATVFLQVAIFTAPFAVNAAKTLTLEPGQAKALECRQIHRLMTKYMVMPNYSEIHV